MRGNVTTLLLAGIIVWVIYKMWTETTSTSPVGTATNALTQEQIDAKGAQMLTGDAGPQVVGPGAPSTGSTVDNPSPKLDANGGISSVRGVGRTVIGPQFTTKSVAGIGNTPVTVYN